MADVSTNQLVYIFTEMALYSAYQSLAAQLISSECISEEDLLLIEFEALASIGDGRRAEETLRPKIDQATRDAKDRLHNSFAAFRRERQRSHGCTKS